MHAEIINGYRMPQKKQVDVDEDMMEGGLESRSTISRSETSQRGASSTTCQANTKATLWEILIWCRFKRISQGRGRGAIRSQEVSIQRKSQAEEVWI